MALNRWIAPAVLAATLGMASLAPTPAKAQSMDELTQAIVNIADVVFRGDQPYYRYGDYGSDDRLAMRRDAYGRPVYYRVANSYSGYNASQRTAPPYGYRGQAPGRQKLKCDRNGKCRAEYYDPRYDRNAYRGR